MGHRLDRGDVIDMLEESIMTKRPFVIVLKHGHEFEDVVTAISARDGEDHVTFAKHEEQPLRHISSCRRAWPLEATYDGK